MNNMLPSFAKPEALLLIPAIWLLLWIFYKSRQKGDYWQQRLPEAFQPWLLQPAQSRQHRTPWLLLASSALLACLALAEPYLPSSQSSTVNRTPAPLILVIELTPDMLASDLPPSRLHQVRDKAMTMLQAQLPGQAAMVVYAGSPHTLMPLSTDTGMADNLLQALHPSLMPKTGHNADKAIALALELLQQGANGHGRIALLTHQLTAEEQAGIVLQLQKRSVPLSIIGVGSLQGAPVPHTRTGHFDTSKQLSRLHEVQLQQFAQKNGFGYARLQYDHQDLMQSGLFIQNSDGHLQGTDYAQAENQGYWLLLPLLLLLAPLARKGWLFTALFFLPLTLPDTTAWADSRPQQIEQSPTTTQQQHPIWLGIAAYHAGNYQLAHDQFAKAHSAIAHYNRGNSLMQLGRYSEAASAYQQALALQPDLFQAKDNRLLAQRLQQQQSTDTSTEQNPNNQTGEITNNQKEVEKTATLPPSATQDFQHGSLDAWLQQIPDNPAALLKRKFRRELLQSAP